MSTITNDAGEDIQAQTPIIVSASRSTDIPAFYADWFISRLKKGYLRWKNPFNGNPLYVSFSNTRLIVFWSKYPEPLYKHISYLEDSNRNFYFQFTLNDYESDKLERYVPKLEKRIEAFVELADRVGKDKVIWRCDPLILSDSIDVPELLGRIERIGDRLKDHTSKLVFSFADIAVYKKVQSNLRAANYKYIEFTPETMTAVARGIQKLNEKWKLQIATCCEQIELEAFGVAHNKCIDDELMIKLFRTDDRLMAFLGVSSQQGELFSSTTQAKSGAPKDKGQRKACGCIASKDIGEYNTCPHGCVYCYANTSIEIARRQFNAHRDGSYGETITES